MDARDREVGRRISALRAGLHAAAESFEELTVEAQDGALSSHDLAGRLEEAKGDVEIALKREMRMREHDHGERRANAAA